MSDLADKYLKHDQEEFEVFSDIVKWSNIPKFCVSISRESYAVGTVSQVEVDETIKKMNEPTLYILTCSKFGRLLLRHQMFHSKLYKCPTKQNSYTMHHDDKFKNCV